MRVPWQRRDDGQAPSMGALAEFPAEQSEGEPTRRANVPAAVAVTLALTLACTTGALATQGRWFTSGGTQVDTAGTGGLGNYEFYEVDESGNRVGSAVASVTGSSGYPGYTPDGYEDDSDDARKAQQAAPANNTVEFDYEDGAVLGDYDPETGTWQNDAPSSLFNVVDKVKYWIVTLIAQLCRGILGIGDWILTIVDPQRLFSAPFDGSAGSYGPLYSIASKVHRTIAVPFGSAFLGLAFVVDVIKLTDRRRYGGVYWFESLLRLCVMYAVTWTLVNHALEVMGAIYWVGEMLHNAVGVALGNTTTLGDLSINLTDTLCDALGTVTYQSWGWAVLYLVLACLTTWVEARLAITVVSIAVMRMGEIYLRAAFAGLPMAFLVSGDTRPTVVQYLKRFAATCFVAATIVVGLAIAPSIVGVVNDVVQANAPDGLGGIGTVLAVGIGFWIGLHSMDGIVKKSGDVANAIFGV